MTERDPATPADGVGHESLHADAIPGEAVLGSHRQPSGDWTRRALLALAAGASAALAGARPAQAALVTVGSLTFAVPTEVVSTADETLGAHWQWRGRDSSPDQRAQTVVLARADLASTDAEEVLGLVLAGSGAGLLPGLTVGTRRTRSMPGGGDQLRVDVGYAASRGYLYHGTMLVATRREPPAGLILVLGRDLLTAGTIDGVLDSARWR